jgi:hypothetical protein
MAIAEEPEIEAWAAIDECEDDDAIPHIPVMAAEIFARQSKLYDSGASCHMSPYCKQFITYHKISTCPITAANNEIFHAIGMGDLEIQVSNGEALTKVLLKDALHAPDLCLTVVSIGCIIKAGYAVEFINDHYNIKRGPDGPIIGQIPATQNGLFRTEHTFAAADLISAEPMDILTLHRRLGHISVDAIRALVRTGSITSVHVIDNFPPFTCNSCEYAKTT